MKDSCAASISLAAHSSFISIMIPYLLVNVQLPEDLGRVKQMGVLVYPIIALACTRPRETVLLT